MARILVIDDDAEVLEFYLIALERAGHEVAAADSGRKGIAMLGGQAFDLIVLDLSMPAPDGFEVLGVLKTKGDAPPVIMVSGAMDDALLRASEFLGAAASLPKCVGARRLVDVVHSVLERRAGPAHPRNCA